MTPRAPRKRPVSGRVLAVLPRLPGDSEPGLKRFLLELCRARPVDIVVALPSRADEELLSRLEGGAALAGAPAPEELAAKARSLAGSAEYEAIVAVDDPSTRRAVEELRLFTRRPIVLVRLDGAREGRPRAAMAGDGFLAPRAARERFARALAAAAEVWSFGLGDARPDAGRIGRRLAALGAAPPERELVSVIVPCVDGLRWTRECLEAVARRTPERHEVILVDNASTDGTARWAAGRRGVRVIRNRRNLGFAKAINQGMAAAKGSWLVWLNNDAVVTPGWLTRMLACGRRAPWIGAVGPCTDRTVGFQCVPAPEFRDERDLVLFSEAWALKNAGQAEGVHRLTGFCLMLRREAYERCGGLDERFGLGTYEEFDYCLRLRQAGYDLVVARDAFVRHHGHKSFRGYEAMAARARANRELFLDKWCHQALAFLDELNPIAAGAPI